MRNQYDVEAGDGETVNLVIAGRGQGVGDFFTSIEQPEDILDIDQSLQKTDSSMQRKKSNPQPPNSGKPPNMKSKQLMVSKSSRGFQTQQHIY